MNAGLLTAAVPEFAALLGTPPDPGDPLTAQGRAQRAAAEVMRAVASQERPVVVFVDDLQWAGRTPLGFVDLVLSEEPVDGLLLVGAYREDEVDAAHPLAAPLSRWRNQAAVQHLRLDNLPGRPRRHGGRDAPRGPSHRGRPGRGDPAPYARQPVRDGGTVERAAPRRAADRDGRRVAVGRGRGARSPGTLQGGRAAGGARRGHSTHVSVDAGGDGMPGRAGRAKPATGRCRRAGEPSGGNPGARP